MKRIIFAVLIMLSASSFSHAQEIIKGMKNSDFLLKGSHKIAQVRLKSGEAILIQNIDDGMQFKLVKNGKETQLFDPSKDYTYGQAAEFDIDGDGANEMLLATRKTAESFEVKIYKKAQFETDYKLFTTISGEDHCEFLGDNTVKIYSEDNKVKHLKFHADGTWITLTN